jgi:translocation and assembly module TamA
VELLFPGQFRPRGGLSADPEQQLGRPSACIIAILHPIGTGAESMNLFPRGLAACLLSVVAQAALASSVTLEAPASVHALLAPYVVEEDFAGDRAQIERHLNGRLPELLATEGYFSPVLKLVERNGDLVLTVDPGPRTQVLAVKVDIGGAIGAERRQSLVDGWTLPVGQPFRQADWSRAKQDLLAQLLADGHPAARLTDSRAEIDTETGGANLSADYDAGPPYRFGAIEIDGLNRYSPELVARYNDTVRPGESYSEDKLAQLQRMLQATPYFSSVQVDIDREGKPEADGSVLAPVRLRVREAQPYRLGFGVGASSNTGARVEMNYRAADLFRRAWLFNGAVRLEERKQSAYADIFLPPDQDRNRNSFGTLFENTNIAGLRTERFLVGAQRAFRRDAVDTRLSLEWQTEKQMAGGIPSYTAQALVANGLWTWRRVDNVVDPRRGFVVQAQIGGGAKAALSDQDFLRLQGRTTYYQPLGDRDTLVLRADVGRTVAPSRVGIPQDYLFRTGGTGSVRGYGYQQLGVQEGTAVVGGRNLLVASAEVDHWLNERWGIAAFVDAGNAADTAPALRPLAVGIGGGVRWRSPAGPIAIDLAYGERDYRLRLHFFLAIPF